MSQFRLAACSSYHSRVSSVWPQPADFDVQEELLAEDLAAVEDAEEEEEDFDEAMSLLDSPDGIIAHADLGQLPQSTT